jgi:DNA-binding HxlR family transcriptional regulator
MTDQTAQQVATKKLVGREREILLLVPTMLPACAWQFAPDWISSRQLAIELRGFRQMGLVCVPERHGPRNAYRLTPLGLAVRAVLMERGE